MGEQDWQPIYERLNMPWIDKGTVSLDEYGAKPMTIISRLRKPELADAEELF
jgi:hypothetical protein